MATTPAAFAAVVETFYIEDTGFATREGLEAAYAEEAHKAHLAVAINFGYRGRVEVMTTGLETDVLAYFAGLGVAIEPMGDRALAADFRMNLYIYSR